MIANGNIKATGLMKDFLLKQKNGLTGHIEKAGYPFDEVEWGDHKILTKLGPAWWVYEQTAYWVDGYTRCAVLLEDDEMLDRAKQIIYRVIDNADKDGYLGPDFLKTYEEDESCARWPHVVFFRACIAMYEYNSDSRILEALEKHYLGYVTDYTVGRNVLNIEIMLWIYSKTHNKELLKLSIDSFEKYNEKKESYKGGYSTGTSVKSALSDEKPYCHGVSYNEYSKLGAILYRYTQNMEYLRSSVCAYKKIDKYFMQIDGLHSSNEYMWSDNIMESHETCNISDFTWSQNYLYEATRNTDYLEKIEKCVFNAGLGSVDNDFKALQYLSSVNQVLCTDYSESSHHNYRGSSAARYAPNPSTACCPGNVNRFIPNYILHMWEKEEEGIYLKLFGASIVEYEECIIEEKTVFPYGNTVDLKIKCKNPFDLFIRLPKWADGAIINSKRVETKKGGFYKVSVCGNTRVRIEFLVTARVNTKKNYAYITKGMLLYSFPVPSNYEKSGDEDFPVYTITPNGTWNYGIKKDAEIVERNGKLYIDGYVLSNWKLKKYKSIKVVLDESKKIEIRKGNFVFTPPIPSKPETDGEVHTIELIPYGKTMTRVTAFPIV